jgi:hypothetical protein
MMRALLLLCMHRLTSRSHQLTYLSLTGLFLKMMKRMYKHVLLLLQMVPCKLRLRLLGKMRLILVMMLRVQVL